MAAGYNGHKDWQHWNVSLWIANDEGLYNLAMFYVRNYADLSGGAHGLLDDLHELGEYETPDGAEYTHETLLAALKGLRDD